MKIFKINQVFFWKKKGTIEIPKAEEMIEAFIKYMPKIKKATDELRNSFNGDFLKRMYDFWAGYRTNEYGDVEEPNLVHMDDKRETKMPMAVAGELEHFPRPFDLQNLDEKIELFKKKTKLISQRFTREQCEGFIQRLENRKHYEEHKKFFEAFPNTNDDKIDDLLSKYKLVLKKSDLFVPTFPKDAVSVMEEYTEVVTKFTKEHPVFYVIAEEADFKKKEKKLDPILLVQSPFGFYWQILGAWDKEMLLLHEL